MEEMRQAAEAYHANLSEDQKAQVQIFFKRLDTDGDEKVSLQEYLTFLRQQGITCITNSNFFRELDQNGDGLVSLDELNWLLERIGVHTTEVELESLIGQTSLDVIDFLLFYDTLIIKHDDNIAETESQENSKSVEDDLAKVFKIFDLNGDGFISSDELQSVLARLGLWDERSGRDCKCMIDVYDMNLDGLLDFEEFKHMMLVTNS